MTTVVAFGTFDVLHPGHLSYLAQARKFGTMLLVVVARDASVERIKGAAPLYSEKERLLIIKALRVVDEARLGNLDDHFSILGKIKPDVVCLGYDHVVTAQILLQFCKERGIKRPRIVRARAYRPERYKSHILKAK
ncbi:MAG: adenylyltransferase/cytidyltransferase family protein [bacterium]|nr:adenylyltransferase/cytidyltransferase family protein [bacterium]